MKEKWTPSQVAAASAAIRKLFWLRAQRSSAFQVGGVDSERLRSLVDIACAADVASPCAAALQKVLIAAVDDGIAGLEAELTEMGVAYRGAEMVA